jgi:hypothetical protein
MRKLLIFLALLAILTSSASAASGWYPQKINTGTELQTDVGSARNGEALIAVQTIPAAETSDIDQIKAASMNSFNSTTHFLMRNTGVGSSGFLAQPDVPRNIIGTMNTSTTGSLKLTGTDISGAVITENLTWAGETGAKSSTKAFKTITRVDGTCTTNTAQFTLGTGNLLGLNTKLVFNSVLYSLVNGALEGTAAAVTTNSAVLSLNTIDTNSAPGGYVTKVYYAVTA